MGTAPTCSWEAPFCPCPGDSGLVGGQGWPPESLWPIRARPPAHWWCDWFTSGNMTQDRPMRLSPETLAGITGNEAPLSPKCWLGAGGWGLGVHGHPSLEQKPSHRRAWGSPGFSRTRGALLGDVRLKLAVWIFLCALSSIRVSGANRVMLVGMLAEERAWLSRVIPQRPCAGPGQITPT